MYSPEKQKEIWLACINIDSDILLKISSNVINYLKSINKDEKFIVEGFNNERFQDLMVMHRMKEYSDVILNYFKLYPVYYRAYLDYVAKWDVLFADVDNEHKYKKDITETLYFFLTQKNLDDISITFQSSVDKMKISNKRITESIFIRLKDDFKLNEFDHEIPKEFEALEAEKPREITQEFLKELIDDGFLEEKSIGAPEKTEYLKFQVVALANLRIINKFLKSKTEINDIEQIKINATDKRFIHDILVFFELINDRREKRSNTTTPENFIHETLKRAWDIKNSGEYKKITLPELIELKFKLNSEFPKK